MIISIFNIVVAAPINRETSKNLTLKETISFSKPTIEPNGEYISLNIKETNTILDYPGKPMIPVFSKTFKFPFGTKIKDVDCVISGITEEEITGTIKLAPEPQTLTTFKNTIESSGNLEQVNHQDIGIYPEKWFNYEIKCGLDKGERTIFVIFHVFPIRYKQSENKILEIKNIDIKIDYEKEEISSVKNNQYDLVIITPKFFVDSVLPLKNHKEKMGISTNIVTIESIYKQYFLKGRDRPEKIKLFIKDAIEDWGITYVLLVGARNHQFFRYFIPVRFSNLEDRSGWNETYVSDLYYADIYKGTGEFEDWDSNGNGIFGEWTWYWKPEWNWWSNDIKEKDVLDLVPDVYIGRLACKNILEVITSVDKIIKYETKSYGKEWFNNMACFGGDSFPSDDGYYEGEEQNTLAASYMEPYGFNTTMYWTSTGTLKDYRDTVGAFNNGIGFVYFAGHGSPTIWCTFPPENDTWVDGLTTKDMLFLKNNDKYPICVVGGCHSSQIDVGFTNIITGILESGLEYFEWIIDKDCFDKMKWVPDTFSWKFIMKMGGGTIATIGNTGLGWIAPGEGCTGSLDGWINSHFFLSYTQLKDDENCTLGMVHSENINSYIETFYPNTNAKHRKTVEQWILLGDPTLKIGGYQP